MIKLDGVYKPEEYEDRIWKFWQSEQVFESPRNPDKTPYTILMPPPNVTSKLHMGHGLGYSIQDLLVRYQRMQGKEAMWLPGTDHAGIATQMMVEQSLKKEGTSRKELGREAFFKRCEQWKDTYGTQILHQFAKLGFSCDWSKLAYTMDPNLSQAVRYVFVELFNEGLIYQSERLVNWDPVLQTAISDDEIEQKEINGFLWHFRYPIHNSSETLTIATTRPETMIGDTAVAVHPQDERYSKFIGKKVELPFTHRLIPIIADDYVDQTFGTGVVKITPAHDPNDFIIGKRHQLEFINVLHPDGTMNEEAPPELQGLDRFVARKKIIQGLKDLGLFVEEKPHKHSVPHSERSKEIIEPRLSLQWFVKMSEMAKEAAFEARSGSLKFHPDSWKKTYLYWLDHIQDWCISRQLWWGHRIPIWYCQSCQHHQTSLLDPDQCEQCGSRDLKQDEDVLDTWFSSWLWPLSPLGWPESSKDFDYYFPTQTLVTAPEIIFLWVARMVMAAKKFTGKIPFSDIYFNATVCDKKGRKFSKTLGNGIDPIEVIEKHGADAVRFTAVSLAPLGGRVRMDRSDFQMGSRFINKLWNAARMLYSHLDPHISLPPIASFEWRAHEAWLIREFKTTTEQVTQCLEQFRVGDAVNHIYHFVWGGFCDWGLEAAKEDLFGDDETAKAQTLSILSYCFEGLLRLAHPVIPFVTEELWQKLPPQKDWDRPKSLALASFPDPKTIPQAQKMAQSWSKVQELINQIRSCRSQSAINPQTKLDAKIYAQESLKDSFLAAKPLIMRLSGIEEMSFITEKSIQEKALAAIGEGFIAFLPIKGHLDIDKEVQRLQQEEKRLSGLLKGIEAKLANQDFLARAPKEVIDENEAKKMKFTAQMKDIRDNLNALT